MTSTFKAIFFLSLSLLLVNCDSNPYQDSNKNEIRYELSSYYGTFMNDSMLEIRISYDGIGKSFPDIQINGVSIDTGYGATVFLYQEPLYRKPFFTYQIAMNRDTLKDTIYIPSRIDSVFCNNILLADTTDVLVDSSENYVFTWKTPSHTTNVQLWSSFYSSSDTLYQPTDSTVVFTQTVTSSRISNIEMELAPFYKGDFSRLKQPNKESGSMYIFYNYFYGMNRKIRFSEK